MWEYRKSGILFIAHGFKKLIKYRYFSHYFRISSAYMAAEGIASSEYPGSLIQMSIDCAT